MIWIPVIAYAVHMLLLYWLNNAYSRAYRANRVGRCRWLFGAISLLMVSGTVLVLGPYVYLFWCLTRDW